MIKSKVYSKDNCPWCDKAIALLESVGAEITIYKYNVDFTKEDLQLVLGRESNITVPQVIINGVYVGGYEDLKDYLQNNGIFGLQG